MQKKKSQLTLTLLAPLLWGDKIGEMWELGLKL